MYRERWGLVFESLRPGLQICAVEWGEAHGLDRPQTDAVAKVSYGHATRTKKSTKKAGAKKAAKKASAKEPAKKAAAKKIPAKKAVKKSVKNDAQWIG